VAFVEILTIYQVCHAWIHFKSIECAGTSSSLFNKDSGKFRGVGSGCSSGLEHLPRVCEDWL
jgi:hypothetical protein